jgi:hypothetical protein
VLVVHETTSELEIHDLEHPIICQCRKHRQLARQEGGFAVCFPLDVPMVHLSQPTIITDSSNLFDIELTRGEIIPFENLEFIADHFDNQSFSPEGNDSGAVFMGMAHRE